VPALFPPQGRVEASALSCPSSASTSEKNHGRIEHRTLESTSILTVTGQWPGLRQGFRICREIQRPGKATVEVVHGITSLSAEQANATRLLEAVRDHWRVENELHYVRDVTLGEDACRVRTGDAAQNMAACRNAVVCLLSRVSQDNRAEAIRRLAARPQEAIDLLNSQE
jgi:predicted transposase YbfD/YdcC